ncbi:MAG: asparagine synthase-related protein, partial [Carboxydocellales bacterium]
KYILKKAMGSRLPIEILNRPKKGFGVPIGQWFLGDLKQLMFDTFEESKIEREGIFNHKYITHLIENHLSGKVDNRKKLWTLLIFELWFKNYR